MRTARRAAVLAAAAALLLTGCGHSDHAQSPDPSSSATDLAHLRKLVDGAESAVRTAESDASDGTAQPTTASP